MNFVFKTFVLLILNFSAFEISAQIFTDTEWEILELTDSRTLGKKGELNDYLHSLDPDDRRKALYALANIGDSSTVPLVNFLFAGPFKDYPEKEDFEAAAFMLGQINCNESRKLLETVFKNPEAFKTELKTSGSYFLDAAGKIGDEKLFTALLDMNDLVKSNDTAITAALAMSVARFAMRKLKNDKSVEVLKELSRSPDKLTLRNTAYALWRTGEKNLLQNAKQEVYNLAESEDPQTRMWAFNALGKLNDKLLLQYTLESFNSEIDWRVKVNMINSIAGYEIDSIPELTLNILSVLGEAAEDSNEHVSLTSISALGNLMKDMRKSGNPILSSIASGLKRELISALNDTAVLSSRQKSEIALCLSKMYKDEVKTDLLEAFSNSDDYLFKGNIIRAMGNFDNYEVYKEVRDSVSIDVKRYNEKYPNTSGELISGDDLVKVYRGFVRMLSDLDDKAGKEDLNTIRLIFTEFASSRDPIITDICLTALRDSLYKDYREETSQVILFDFDQLKYPENESVILIFIDAMNELYNDTTLKVLENLTGFSNYEIAKASKDVLEKITWKKYGMKMSPYSDLDKNYLNDVYSKKYVTLLTSAGNINIELMPDIAPFTVMNFLKLAEKDFYDNTVFHRVVPNFVIQGGDPSGTGYGGPGYSIRSEFSPVGFETGYLGMASSGKDTEGSQFFITHSSTPHLDGKYSVFGKVVEGMDVVDKIQIGDFIKDIVVKYQ